MELAYIKKGVLFKWYKMKIAIKKHFLTASKSEAARLDSLLETIKKKKKIVVLASGPSALKLQPSDDAFYVVTNDSYKMVANNDFLYYIKDGYFVNRFIANGPYTKKHQHTLFYWLKAKEKDVKSFDFFQENLRIEDSHNFYYFSDILDNNFSESDWTGFYNFITKENKLPFKIQNSGIFILLLGFYLSSQTNLPLEIYGLDLGVGGNVHFNNKGHVGDAVTRDDIKKNVKMYLDSIYKSLGMEVKNHSNFKSAKIFVRQGDQG